MITKIRLQNWKSFKDSTIYIDSLGILIGTNASGKSNVLDAFAFLRAVGDGKSLLMPFRLLEEVKIGLSVEGKYFLY